MTQKNHRNKTNRKKGGVNNLWKYLFGRRSQTRSRSSINNSVNSNTTIPTLFYYHNKDTLTQINSEYHNSNKEKLDKFSTIKMENPFMDEVLLKDFIENTEDKYKDCFLIYIPEYNFHLFNRNTWKQTEDLYTNRLLLPNIRIFNLYKSTLALAGYIQSKDADFNIMPIDNIIKESKTHISNIDWARIPQFNKIFRLVKSGKPKKLKPRDRNTSQNYILEILDILKINPPPLEENIEIQLDNFKDQTPPPVVSPTSNRRKTHKLPKSELPNPLKPLYEKSKNLSIAELYKIIDDNKLLSEEDKSKIKGRLENIPSKSIKHKDRITVMDLIKDAVKSQEEPIISDSNLTDNIVEESNSINENTPMKGPNLNDIKKRKTITRKIELEPNVRNVRKVVNRNPNGPTITNIRTTQRKVVKRPNNTIIHLKN